MNTQTIDITNTVPMEKLMEELRLMVGDAEELLLSTANQTGEGAAAARARIQKSLHTVKGRLAAAETAVIERTRQAAKATDQYVHDNPWKAIGISVCAGVIVGMLVARR
jgi:ElaB/YqjD/DUF883 family membrane-anchored ribosome-binding protein